MNKMITKNIITSVNSTVYLGQTDTWFLGLYILLYKTCPSRGKFAAVTAIWREVFYEPETKLNLEPTRTDGRALIPYAFRDCLIEIIGC